MNIEKLKRQFESLSSLYIITIIVALTFLVYINTLGNSLFYDDEDFIYKNQYVATFNVPKFFTENLIAGAGKVSNYYRPLLEFSFSLEHLLVGNSPFLYHLDSMILQAACAVLLYILIKKLFSNNLLAFLTSLLFAIHPLQTEAVSYVSGRGDPLSLLFILVTLLFSLSSNRKKKILSFGFTVCALLSKEIALIIPLLIILISLTSSKIHSKKTFYESIKKSIPYFLICGTYFFLRITILNFQNTLNFYNGANIYTSNILIRLNTFFNLIPKYISLLFYPNPLFIERPSTVYASLTVSSILVPLISVILFILAIKFSKRIPLILFSLLWFYLAFIPTSGVIPINGIFYEHFVYIPSIGFFLLLSWGILALLAKSPVGIKILLIIIFLSFVSFLCLKTIARNAEWHDPITFYTQTLSYTKSGRLLNNLAMAYAEEGNYKESIVMYKKALEEGDYYPQTRYNLGNSYLAIGENALAEEEYKKSLALDPLFYYSYLKLFNLYQDTHNEDGKRWVINYIEALVEKNPSFQTLLQQLNQAK